LGTVNLLELVRKKAPDALLAYSSTNKVYGDLKSLRYVEKETRYTLPDYPNGIDESMPLYFASPYGCSKGCADQYVRDWFRNFGIATVVFRHSSIYGGRQFATVDQGWIGWFTRHAIMQREAKISNMNIESFTISGSGKQVRDVLHSEDLIALYKSAYLNRKNCAGEIFNIGGGFENSLSLLELFDLLSSMLRIQDGLAYSKINRRVSDQDFFVADISKAERLLGWKPRITTTDGLSRMIDWVTSFIYQ
jgi:CDP-paratose 2-epimerase